MKNTNDGKITDEIRILAHGPNYIARRFKVFDVNNRYRSPTKDYKRVMNIQNNGVMVVAKTQSYASTSDSRSMLGDVAYYGALLLWWI